MAEMKDAPVRRLPILASLLEQNRGRPPGFVYDALSEGNMRRVGAQLDVASRRAVAEFFTADGQISVNQGVSDAYKIT